jgi:hypothetical protein
MHYVNIFIWLGGRVDLVDLELSGSKIYVNWVNLDQSLKNLDKFEK